ncbi:hypothetical protein ACTXT7_005506 [Hymenolepis weldensis]
MSFTIQQIKPSWSELFLIVKSSVLSGLLIVDVAAMPLGDYSSCPLRCLRWGSLDDNGVLHKIGVLGVPASDIRWITVE